MRDDHEVDRRPQALLIAPHDCVTARPEDVGD
jgi:hypothetical protein